MSKIRVLTLISGLAIGEPLGGAERFGLEVARKLDPDRFESIVCAFWRRGMPAEQHWAEYLGNAGVETFFAVDRGKGFGLARYRRGLGNIVEHPALQPVDVVHSHFQLGSLTALLLKQRLAARALVRTAHGSLPWEWNNHLSGFVCRQIFTRWVFPIAFDAEAGVSQAVVSSLDRRAGVRLTGKRTILIPNAICWDQFQRDEPAEPVEAKRREMGFATDHVIVGSVGRLSEQKGYAYLVQAIPAIVAARPNTRFLIVGDGELRDQLHHQVHQLGLSDVVVFAGARRDVAALLRIMDLFVLPSLWEGLPTVVLESIASGVPVVATDIPGTRELIQGGQTGWLAQPADPASLAACVLDALSSPAKREALALAALRAARRFSIQHVAGQYEALYQRLLER